MAENPSNPILNIPVILAKKDLIEVLLLVSGPSNTCAVFGELEQMEMINPFYPFLEETNNHYLIKIRCWGDHQYKINMTPNSDVYDVSKNSQVSVGMYNACATFTSEHVIHCWGLCQHGICEYTYDNGHIKYQNRNSKSKYKLVNTKCKHIMQVSIGDNHVCTLNNHYEPNCWGLNSAGETVIPLEVGEDVVEISAGEGYTCARKVNGYIQCWGNLTYNHNQINHTLSNDTHNKYGYSFSFSDSQDDMMHVNINANNVPEYISHQITTVAAGSRHTCVVVDGDYKCWGNDDYGQCSGISHTHILTHTHQSQSYLQYDSNNTADQLNYNHILSAQEENTYLYSMEENDDILSFLQNNHILENYLLSFYYFNQFNDKSFMDYGGEIKNKIRDKVYDMEDYIYFKMLQIYHEKIKGLANSIYNEYNTDSQINTDYHSSNYNSKSIKPKFKNAKLISAGWDYTCTVNLQNEVDCFGLTLLNQSDVPDYFKHGAYTIHKIVAGLKHICVLYSSTKLKVISLFGRVACWGDSSNEFHETSAPLYFSTYIEDLALGDGFTCVLRNFYIYCWGDNEYGQAHPPFPFFSHKNNYKYTMLAAGAAHVCALATSYIYATHDHYDNPTDLNSKNIICWGSDSQGQTTVPSMIKGKSVMVATGTAHTCVIIDTPYQTIYKSESNIVCWGMVYGYTYLHAYNNNQKYMSRIRVHNPSALGQNANAMSSADNPNIAVFLSTGYEHDCAIMMDGSGKCWGENDYDQVEINRNVYTHT